jgi:hypothetical protein
MQRLWFQAHNSTIRATEDRTRARRYRVDREIRYIVVREKYNVTVDGCVFVRLRTEFVLPRYDIWRYVLRRTREITSRRIPKCFVFMFEIPAGEASWGTTRASYNCGCYVSGLVGMCWLAVLTGGADWRCWRYSVPNHEFILPTGHTFIFIV